MSSVTWDKGGKISEGIFSLAQILKNPDPITISKDFISWSFVRRQIVSSKSMSKNSSEILSNQNTSDDNKKIVHFGILIHVLS